MIQLNKSNILESKDNVTIQFKPESANILSIVTNHQVELGEDNTTLCTIGNVDISVGEEIMITFISGFVTKYTCNYIISVTDSIFAEYLLLEDNPTKTNTYLTPILGKDYKFFSTEGHLINSYISEDYNSLYLKYRFSNTESFTELDKNLTNHSLYAKDINTNKYFISYKFTVPITFKEDVQLILDGKFSKVSNKLKKQILKFYNAPKDSHITGVLYKTKEKKKYLEQILGVSIPDDIDLDSKPDLQLELWKDD